MGRRDVVVMREDGVVREEEGRVLRQGKWVSKDDVGLKWRSWLLR